MSNGKVRCVILREFHQEFEIIHLKTDRTYGIRSFEENMPPFAQDLYGENSKWLTIKRPLIIYRLEHRKAETLIAKLLFLGPFKYLRK